MDFFKEYKAKLKTPEEAVKVVKSGDWIDYNVALAFPTLLDKALAARKDELEDIKIRGYLTLQQWNVILTEKFSLTILGTAAVMSESWWIEGFATSSLWCSEI